MPMRSLRAYPTQISLKDLPLEGKDYTYSRESGELNQAFSDLLPPNESYRVDLHIKPIGNAYEMTGTLKTQLSIGCALCGLDLPYPVQERIQEILIIADELPRDGHTAKVNHVTELIDGPSSQVLPSDMLDVAEFLHEILALSIPIRLTKDSSCDAGLCPEIKGAVTTGTLNLDPKANNGSTHKPFGILEGLKLKS